MPRRADLTRADPGQEGRDVRRRLVRSRRGDGGHAPADREPCAAGLRLRRSETRTPGRHHFWRGPFLCQPVRQGRAGLWRRYRRLQHLRAARQPAGGRGRGGGRHGDHADDRARTAAAVLGRRHGHVDGRLPLHRQDPYWRPLFQRWLVLWRLQGDAGKRLLLRASAGP